MVNSSRFASDPWIDKPWGSTLREKLPRSVRLRYVNWRFKKRQQHPSLEGAEWESSPLTAGEETPTPQVLIGSDEAVAGKESSVLAASSRQADTRGRPRGSLRGVARWLGLEEAPRGSGA